MPTEKRPTQMQAIVARDGKLVLEEVPVPTPGPREILIKVAAAALNRADVLQAKGLYPPPPGAPATLGLEVSGTIAAIGADVRSFKGGERVCALLAGGGYTQYAAIDEGSALPVPSPLSMIEAAALPEAYFTVWTNVVERARLAHGETFLVHGGASGIGTTAIALFAARGHRVFTTAGDAQKVALCRKLGAARAINYREEDFVKIIKDETGGNGVDVILDMVGGDYIARNIAALARDGRLVNIAYQNGAKAEIDFLQVMLRRLTITGSTLRARPVEEKAQIASALRREVWPLLEKGTLKPVIDSVFPLAEAGKAHARMEAGSHAGKIVLEV